MAPWHQRLQAGNITLASKPAADIDMVTDARWRRLEAIAANSPGIIYERVMRADGTIEYPFISATIRRIYGLEPEQVMARPQLLLDTLHRDDRARFRESLRESAAKLTHWRLEFRIIDVQGREHWILGNSHPRRRANGDTVWDGLLLDITDQKRAEAALAISDRRFQDFAEASADWFWETDAGHKLTYVSSRFEDVLGLAPETRIGKGWFEFQEPVADAPNRRQHLDAMNAHRPFRDIRHVVADKSGRLRHISASGKPFFDPDGQFLGYRGSCSDITEIIETQETVSRNQTRFLNALEGLSEGIAYWDASDRLVFCNGRYRAQSGAAADLLQAGITFEAYMRESLRLGDVPHAVGREEKWLSERMAIHRNPPSTFEVLRSGRWLLVREERTNDGGILITTPDVTELKQREQALQAAIQQAEAANRAKSAFLANMSHELRTPLNAVIGFAEIIEADRSGNLSVEKYREYAADIAKSGRHLLGIINDVLDLSKIEAGQFELVEEIVDLADVVQDSLDIVGLSAERAGIDLKSEMTPELPRVRADPRALRQILLNLLANAIKFTETGGQVTLEAECEVDGAMRMRVRDTGIGMAEDDIVRALTPFSQLDQTLSRRYEGTGLGLPLSKSLTELHGGSLEIESDIGVGTSVSVRLPAHRVVVDESRAPTQTRG